MLGLRHWLDWHRLHHCAVPAHTPYALTFSWCSRTRTTMPPKSATKYKYGKKRKRKTPYNFQKRSAVRQPVPDHDKNDALPESSDAEDNEDAIGLVPRSAPDSGRGVSQKIYGVETVKLKENFKCLLQLLLLAENRTF
ncbi:hypothetical protein HPB50_003067 [Hyalomma asiaticum]|uniref:Uncharacterized protein n=1 Tax=Hyalomma asiaticum TaxID=266040 RepID=A0ACB7T3P1_HYAAI|nr:hypothetical protein HPB50_003067 [Hyalomma asiaticum]